MNDNTNNHDSSNGQYTESTQPQDQIPGSPTPIVPPPGLWSGEEPVGSITSPCETGRYRMVLRDYAATVQIEGSLVTLDYTELDSEAQAVKKTVLCQVSRMRSQNIHHENRILGALLRERGRIPGLSGFADHKEVDLLPMDTILVDKDVHQLPRNIPPMGTDIRFASIQDVRNFSGHHQSLFNIGYLYETKVPVGLMLKHFGPGDDGWGDAHMLGVFGVSGSGKSVMAASIIAGFAARHEMGMLIVDPQGQFSGFEMGKDARRWSWRLDEAFRLVGRGSDVTVVNIGKIALESPTLFAHLLMKYKFFDLLGILGPDKKERTQQELAIFLSEWLRVNKEEGRTLGDINWDPEIAEKICYMGAITYAESNKYEKLLKALEDMPYKKVRAGTIWEKVRLMFARPYKITELLDDVLIKRRIIILNVDAEDDIKDLYCSEILDGIRRKAETIYRIKQGEYWRGDPVKEYKDIHTNALIVIDEAHRFAPQTTNSGSSDEQSRMLESLKDAIRTTRKLGVGWCYVTQSIANFNKDIFRQIQTKILGVGIGTGADNEHLESAFNKDSDLIERYRNLPRPITTGVFPFAIVGELVALGNGSRALFVSAPKTQKELFDLNPEHFKYNNGDPVQNPSNHSSQVLVPRTNRVLLPPVDDDIPF